jgi:hypothetical protein
MAIEPSACLGLDGKLFQGIGPSAVVIYLGATPFQVVVSRKAGYSIAIKPLIPRPQKFDQ